MPVTAAKLGAIRGFATLQFASLVAATIPFVVLDEAKAQQGPGPMSQNSAGAAENDDQDFTRPENLFQRAVLYSQQGGPRSPSQ